MSAIRAVIVDDMAPARAKLRRYLLEDSRVTVVGEAASCRQAALLIAEQRPQIAFLDIHLPDGSGMDLLEGLATAVRPISIFVSAFEQHALRAFEMDARDYLLKPFARDRFRLALTRAIEQLSYRAARQDPAENRPFIRQISFKEKSGRRIIDLSEVDPIVADDHYLSVTWRGRLYLIRGSLGVLERQLDPDTFMRVHRSAIVRIASVRAIRERSRSNYALQMRDGSDVPISRRHHTAVRARLSLISF